MASIYIESMVSEAGKPELVMLHGWAMHSGLMKGLAEKLTPQVNVHLVDLPGHGQSITNSLNNITDLASDVFSAVKSKVSTKTIWLGWSLGGLVAMKVAELFPDNVSKLVLLASTPAFVKRDDWLHAVDKSVFENFASDLRDDLKSTITRFLSLQVRGADDSRNTLKQLRNILFSKELANERALRDGLLLLKQTDLRDQFKNLQLPILLLNGERDTLIPQAVVQDLAGNNIKSNIIENAGHAPFLSHPDQCAEIIKGFCHV